MKTKDNEREWCMVRAAMRTPRGLEQVQPLEMAMQAKEDVSGVYLART